MEENSPAMPCGPLLLDLFLQVGIFLPGGSSLAKCYYIPSPYTIPLKRSVGSTPVALHAHSRVQIDTSTIEIGMQDYFSSQ